MKKRLFKKNFLMVIRNSTGTNMFRNFYYKNLGDVLKNGDLSCAFFVSTILLMFGFVNKVSFRVVDVIDEMEEKGWKEITRLRKGAVIIWNPVTQNSGNHLHIGFYVGERKAISNRSSIGVPGEHSVTASGLDKEKTKIGTIRAIYWHEKLG